MARLPRFTPAGLPQHVIQRGNNRSACFSDNQDFSAYGNWLKEYSVEYGVAVHAWVFMTNHVHLLVTPDSEGSLSSMMQALGRRYVRYFNYQHRRSGTLWEGRFKSSLVQTETYLLQCYRYIELNPVRAFMVNDPAEYPWSSYRCNGLGVETALCTAHQEYLKLGKNKVERTMAYRSLFREHLEDEQLLEIRCAVNKTLALGSDHFKEEVEGLYGRRVKPAKMGRPSKSLI
ncbi:MAG: transposase [SAR86 cluster bacterium]|uniref:Transposase n=1 Tax=SAR86 cluster bacterium TaxID=2030880 RepID=A0A2A5C779_9GAMM|nr:MAG: transposase [SAR86 cluster bacterium]